MAGLPLCVARNLARMAWRESAGLPPQEPRIRIGGLAREDDRRLERPSICFPGQAAEGGTDPGSRGRCHSGGSNAPASVRLLWIPDRRASRLSGKARMRDGGLGDRCTDQTRGCEACRTGYGSAALTGTLDSLLAEMSPFSISGASR